MASRAGSGLARSIFTAYRASGADLPFGDLLAAHGVAMEGYFWRFTDPSSGRAVIALHGVNRGPHQAEGSRNWSTLGMAAHPGGFVRTTAHPEGEAAADRIGAFAGDAFHGTADAVRVDLGEDARIEVDVVDPVPWPRRIVGGSSVFHVVPGLNQYWHPWLLGGRAHGHAVIDGATWDIDGWDVYAEKNWGKGGFPDSWWWGQAQGFEDREVCVAFAGGDVHVGPLRTRVTAVVVLLPGGRLIRLGDPVVSPVRAEVSDEHWRLRGRSAQWQVNVDGFGDLGAAHVLPVPLPAERRNTAGAIEHLGATMQVRVRRWGRTVWQGESTSAALEHGGIERAQAEIRRRGGHPDAVDAPPLGHGRGA